MKYALRLLLRFNTQDERDKTVDALKQVAEKQFTKDDAYIQTHICFHDEDPNRPCTIEEKWIPS